MMSSGIPKRAKDVAFRRVGQDMLLVSGSRGTIYTLNEVGTYVWEAADGDASVDQIVAMVTSAFQVDPADARSDVARFLGDLADLGVLTVIEGEAS